MVDAGIMQIVSVIALIDTTVINKVVHMLISAFVHWKRQKISFSFSWCDIYKVLYYRGIFKKMFL